jgi:hypothetical protein
MRGWWGYADADRTLVGVIVIALLCAAIGHVLWRYLERRR